MAFVTERDIFLSNHPTILLHSFLSNDCSENSIPEIWRKYRKIDLIKWDPDISGPFFDTVSQRIISLNDFSEKFDTYSLLALQRLSLQLDRSIKRWSSNSESIPFQKLNERIKDRINEALDVTAIISA